MSDNAAPDANALAAPVPSAGPGLSEELLETCLKTKRPVYRAIEDLLPDYLRWGHGEIQREWRQQYNEDCHPEIVYDILVRAVRAARRHARIAGPETVVTTIQSRSYVPFRMAWDNAAMAFAMGFGTCEKSDDEDEEEAEMDAVGGRMAFMARKYPEALAAMRR
ncbi:hypothetical protein CLAFUW4_07028 [Fulvia fulva]|uniref:Uncharacterized protein n=1 Tax=Passalora fulva TaxID=5499 RepID=A0A9Q8P9V7_PASFU|nr:uncharacterized protein CLAFUR5_07164 [Fulvia fulva]KAK4621403.1 hypothetical protein CLAFUR4_07037 [Fulvia fulva]KAK4623286.1 hypothetical protein CLAFUR0_07035 [Fulvia fulva]UJO18481.1 hypothetical protein CLAFUR5_07164 [Fulvia fulva]WPV16815.1 hypothetical protein CLAFUW4_07028 [Fulvia fulva]WPV30789.1 hypothetical protein CLAFUW7_07028 [Fulvia fulva]